MTLRAELIWHVLNNVRHLALIPVRPHVRLCTGSLEWRPNSVAHWASEKGGDFGSLPSEILLEPIENLR